MKNLLGTVKKVLIAAAFVAVGGAAQATVVSSGSNNPLNFSWSFDTGTAAGIITGTGTMTVSGFNSTSLTVAITLNNTSGLSTVRLTSFGFGIDPNATGISSFIQGDGGMVGAKLDNLPSLATIEVCAYGGNNCNGGANGGIQGGDNDSFSVVLAGTWGDEVNIDPIGFKFQTGSGSFEFTTTSTTTTTSTSTSSGQVPEPASAALALLGLALLGAGFGLRGKSLGSA